MAEPRRSGLSEDKKLSPDDEKLKQRCEKTGLPKPVLLQINKFLGDIDNPLDYEASYTQAVLENESIDVGTKLLYLERAITMPCKEFLIELDKLYQPEPGNLDLIRALKSINDLSQNNEIKFETGQGIFALTYVVPVISHYFRHLMNPTQLDVLSKKITDEIKNCVGAYIKREKQRENTDLITEQRALREEEEQLLYLNYEKHPNWRKSHSNLLGLPNEQLFQPEEYKNLSAGIIMDTTLLDLIDTYKLTDGEARIVNALSDIGFQGKHLQEWKEASSHLAFTTNHRNAFSSLVQEHKLSPDQAIEEMKGLSYNQTDALTDLYNDGLRGQHLRDWRKKSPNIYFSRDHHDLLRCLIRDQKQSPEAAVATINNLASYQIQKQEFRPVVAEKKEKEVKEKEKKEAPTLGSPAQISFLNNLLSVSVKGVLKYQTYLEDKPTPGEKVLSMGTKMLYLERAMTLPSDQFLLMLDKLYQPPPKHPKTKNEIDNKNEGINHSLIFIAHLKRLNDLCQNSRMPNGTDAYSYYFHEIGKIEIKKIDENTGQKIDPDPAVLKNAAIYGIPSHIEACMKEMKNIPPENEILAEKEARKKEEEKIEPQAGWRPLLVVPHGTPTSTYQLIGNRIGMRNDRDYTQLSARTPRQELISRFILLDEADLCYSDYDGTSQEQKLNQAQQEAINESKTSPEAKRITTELLTAWQQASPNIIFHAYHRDALHRLINEHGLTAASAIEEMKGLNHDQGYYLSTLYPRGLRKNHFTVWQEASPNIIFSGAHGSALSTLMNTHQLSPIEAINELTGLNKDQASTLNGHYSNGLRKNHFIAWQESSPNIVFAIPHQLALSSLVRIHQLSPIGAINELKGLESEQAFAIEQLFSRGLRADHLRHWRRDSRSIPFTTVHIDALTRLLNNGQSPDVAIAAITGKNADEARAIATTPAAPRPGAGPSIDGMD